MDLRYLLKNIQYQSRNISENISVKGVSSDSRNIQKGDLFIAVKGFEFNGHNFIEKAVESGAVAVVAEKYNNKKYNIPLILVDNTRKVKSEIVRRFYEYPDKNMDIIGVTGTNGKTTVSFLLESILQTEGKNTGLFNTLFYRWGEKEISAQRTTPDSSDIYKYLSEMKNQGVTSLVMEVSSHALSLFRVEGLQFKAAVFTNISRDHLEFHDTMDDYADAKSKLFMMLRSDGIGVINGDDEYAEKMIKAANQKAVTVGENPDNDYHINDTHFSVDYSRFTLDTGNTRIIFKTALKGHFNILNCAIAAVTAIEIGCDIAAVKQGIERIKTIPGRMEYIEAAQGFLVIVDYAHTPEAIENILLEVNKITHNRVIAVFGCGGDRDKGKRPLMGKKAVEHSDYTVVTTDNPRTENPSLIIADILRGIKKNNKIKIIEDRKQAIQYALDIAEKNDSVVILGKGHETYQEIGTQRYPFDDKKIVKEYLGL